MKFLCDQCGKKYATAGDPAPGKVYKLKCKACGHLIVVKGQPGTMTAIPAITDADLAQATQAPEPVPTPHPGIDLHVEPEPVTDDAIEPLPPASSEPLPGASAAPLPPADATGQGPLPPEVATAADAAASPAASEPATPPLALDEPPEASPALLDPALVPPPPEMDEVGDFAAAAAEAMAPPAVGEPAHSVVPGYVDIFGESGVMKPVEDRFTAAARASLPDGWVGGAPPTSAPPPDPAPRPPPPMLAQARPKPKAGLGGMPIAIIGLGMLALVGITAYALLGHRDGGPPAIAAQRPEQRPPTPPPVEPVVVPPPEPAAPLERRPDPAPEPRAAERKAEPRPRPQERKPERKPEPRVAERKPEPARPPPEPKPDPKPDPEPRTESGEVELPDASAALTQDVVNKVVGANRKAFSACIANAGSSGVPLDGRRVALRITVNTNGTVTYPTLDDQSLNTTEMGQCLKSAARLMIFPKFKGDPYHYEVPLILGGN